MGVALGKKVKHFGSMDFGVTGEGVSIINPLKSSVF